MTEHAAILETLGIDEHLLHTRDERPISLVSDDPEKPFGRLFLKSNGRVVLRTGSLGAHEPRDFIVKVKKH